MFEPILAMPLVAILLAGAGTAEDEVYTLYRNSVTALGMRIHVATFDATKSGEGYNFENCNVAADLFRQQPGVLTRFWCERGRYRK
jgi:hypothetical protein